MLSENINIIKLRRIDRKETTISQIEQNKLIRELSNTPDNEIITSYKETITNRVSTSKEVKKLNEWLSDDEKLLTEVANWYREKPEWWGIDPDNTDVFYRTPDEVKEIRKKPGESGGHHPHGLALGGLEGQRLIPTGETVKVKNTTHCQVTGFQRRVINRIKKKLK